MAKHINEIGIQSYRGITNFMITDLGDINIVLGKNNSGKTSMLETIQILNRPYDFENIVMIARQRDRFRMIPAKFTQSQYSSFLSIFNRLRNNLSISVNCSVFDKNISLELAGEISESLLSEDQLAELKRFGAGNKIEPAIDEEVRIFHGKLNVKPEEAIDIMLHKYSRIMRSGNSKALFPLSYLSPIDHVVNDRFSEITRSKEMTRRVVDLLNASFDSKIQDLRTVEDDDGRTIRMIDHVDLGYMPITTYGDGIKKVISLANAAAAIKDGVFLVDEFETALHPDAMVETFKFIMKVCKDRNLQLFLTTHSIEAVEKLLGCADELDRIRVVTLYKNNNNTTARILNGHKALYVKDELGLELR